MPLEVTEVTADAEFREMVDVQWASFEQPYCRPIRLFFPILGGSPSARAAAISESVARQLQWHKADPTSHWIKVVDNESGKIVGAAVWHVYKENLYVTVSDEECTWYPAGEGRDMANSLMEQFLTPRMQYMAKPQICKKARLRVA